MKLLIKLILIALVVKATLAADLPRNGLRRRVEKTTTSNPTGADRCEKKPLKTKAMKAAVQLLSGNSSKSYSPVTLNHEWPTLSRLMLVVIMACIGTIINGFFVASFCVQEALRKVGNVFLACVGLSDLILTACVMPVSSVVLLSGQWDNIPVCHALHFLTLAAAYSYSVFFALAAMENYYKLCGTPAKYDKLLRMRMGVLCVSIFTICFIFAAIGVYFGLDYDYCERAHHGNYYYRLITLNIFHGVPFVYIVCSLFYTIIRIQRHANFLNHYRRSQQYDRDFCTTNLNITVYLLYVVAWVPCLIIIYEEPYATDTKYYNAAWLGVFRSTVTSALYSILHKHYRKAFTYLFYYCFCKSTVTSSGGRKNKKFLELDFTYPEVRVHIMHQGVNFGSIQRGSSSIRETQDL